MTTPTDAPSSPGSRPRGSTSAGCPSRRGSPRRRASSSSTGSAGTRAICNRPAPRIDVSAGADLIAAAPSSTSTTRAGRRCTGLGSSPTAAGSRRRGQPHPRLHPQGVGLYVPTVEALRRIHGESASVQELLEASLAPGLPASSSRPTAPEVLRPDRRRAERASRPGHEVEVLSTLGAGDVFHGALVAAVVRGLPLDEQLALRQRRRPRCPAAASTVARASRPARGPAAVGHGATGGSGPGGAEPPGPRRTPTGQPPHQPPTTLRSPFDLARVDHHPGSRHDRLTDQTPTTGASACRPWPGPVAGSPCSPSTSARRCAPCSPSTRPSPSPTHQLTDFKLAATRVLTPVRVRCLVDKQFAFDAVVDAGAVAPTCGLIAAADHFIAGQRRVRHRRRDRPRRRPGRGARPGCGRHEAPRHPPPRRATSASPHRDGRGVRRPVPRPPAWSASSSRSPRRRATAATGTGTACVVEAARELGSLGADLYKAEVPLKGQGQRGRDPPGLRRDHRGGLLAVGGPVLRRAGRPLPPAVELACCEGASGFLAGRAVWASVIGSDDVERDLREISIPRLQRLGADRRRGRAVSERHRPTSRAARCRARPHRAAHLRRRRGPHAGRRRPRPARRARCGGHRAGGPRHDARGRRGREALPGRRCRPRHQRLRLVLRRHTGPRALRRPGPARPAVVLPRARPGRRPALAQLDVRRQPLRPRPRRPRAAHPAPGLRRPRRARLRGTTLERGACRPAARGRAGAHRRARERDAADVVAGARRRCAAAGSASSATRPPGFTPSQYDAALLDSALRDRDRRDPGVESMFEWVEAVPTTRPRGEHADAVAAQPSLAAVDGGQALTSAADHHRHARLAGPAESLSGMAIRCWPEFPDSARCLPVLFALPRRGRGHADSLRA